jgi:fatty-acyl-CoA synthase
MSERLRVPCCQDCGEFHFYPRSFCPKCGSERIEWREASGAGTVYSYTIVQRAPSPAFAREVPYVVATVALAEGPHLMTRIVGIPPEKVRIGMAVRAEMNHPGKNPVFAASLTIAQALADAAQRWPQAEALVVAGERITYSGLWSDVRRIAANLKRLGLRRGEHLALLMGNSSAWVKVAYAATTLGATVVPVNTRFKTEELRYCLAQSDAHMLVLADRFLNIDYVQMLRSICPAVGAKLPDPALPLLRNVIVLGEDVPAAAQPYSELQQPQTEMPDADSEGVQPDDVALIQYTSGTTSFPKGAMLSHAGMLRDAWEASRRMGIAPGDRYFSARPLFHVSGTVLSMFLSMISGACYLTTPWFDVAAALRTMEEEKCTHTSGNDTMFLMMIDHSDFPKRKLSLRGGLAAAKYAVMEQIQERMSLPAVCCGYGLSEASPNVALSPHDDLPAKRFAGYAFPLPGVEVKIVEGEILVRGWGVMKGYYKMPEQTAKAIDAEGWLHTGDMGAMDEEGRLLFIDRIKDVFRVGGENVAPAEVEEVLHGHPAIKQAQVVGVPDARLMEVAAAYVQLREGATVAPEQVIAWCKERCANFKVPRYVRIVASFDHIGMTASAKIQRNKLREYALKDLGLGGTA